ncbi:unnamed protein product [Rangifer tarandus platyrhynchus]|uniref:Uncharacterized protein n=1 Tax=Rangifer tarandus platyrhynchus TaxID=3082113 RepID=A0AC59Y9R2_RANTA
MRAPPVASGPGLRKRISFWGGGELTGSGGAWPRSRWPLSGLLKPGVALESCPGREKLFPGSLGEEAGLERSWTTPAKNLVQQQGWSSGCRPVGTMLPIAW